MKKGIIKIILTAMTAMLLIAIPLSTSAAEADTEGAAPVTEEAERVLDMIKAKKIPVGAWNPTQVEKWIASQRGERLKSY